MKHFQRDTCIFLKSIIGFYDKKYNSTDLTFIMEIVWNYFSKNIFRSYRLATSQGKRGCNEYKYEESAKQLQFHSLKTCGHITPVSRVLIQNCIYLMCERGSRRVSCVSYENLLKYLVSLELSMMGHTISYRFKCKVLKVHDSLTITRQRGFFEYRYVI